MTVSLEELLGHSLNDVEDKNSPKVPIHVSGSMSIPLPTPRVAIVGTRTPSEKGKNTAFKLAEFLAGRGVTIISGLARGIDAQAHRGAMKGGGKTIAVLGTPLNRHYPRENHELQLEIMKNHLAVSQFSPDNAVQRRNFVMRNRTMALLCDASIIVEAGENSGTLSQGWEALRLGRPLYIWHSVLENKEVKWPLKFLDYGAIVLSDPNDILEDLPSNDLLRDIVQL